MIIHSYFNAKVYKHFKLQNRWLKNLQFFNTRTLIYSQGNLKIRRNTEF